MVELLAEMATIAKALDALEQWRLPSAKQLLRESVNGALEPSEDPYAKVGLQLS